MNGASTIRHAPTTTRRPQIGTYTPVLASDGADLAAALQTIREIGAADELDASIEDAFPGSRISVANSDGYLEIEMRQHGLSRPLRAAELSDGAMRYLLLVAALLSPRPPAFLALNEPEASLHPDLLAPLARLIENAARRSQVVGVTLAPRLVNELSRAKDARVIALEKTFGETTAPDVERPDWTWPSR